MLNSKSLFCFLATGDAPTRFRGGIAIDSAPSRRHAKTLAAHDRRFHPDGFNPETDTCGLRADLASKDSPDTALSGASAAKPKKSQEYEAVVAKYRNTPLWMKAPNGKPTNLDERQWVQVRTPSFKKWFGDWDQYVLGFASESDCKAAVKNWRDSRKEFRNKANGRVAELKADWSKLFSAEAKGESDNYEAHYAAVMALDRLFENSVRMWGEKPRNGSSDISEYAKYGQPFVFDGSVYLAKMTVKEYAAHVGIKDGFYSIEAVSVEKVNVTGNNGDISVKGRILDRDVASIIAKRISECNGVSKVVDENGEPMVVFHGTKDRFDVFTGGDERNSSWFAEKIGYAREYAGNPEDGNVDAWVKHCFLNVRNPFDMRNGENVVDGYAEISSTRHDGGEATDAEISKIARLLGTTPDDVRTRFNNRQIWEITQSHEFAERLRSRGYDGIKFVECGDPTWAIFDSNQVKSATDNSGAFSTTSDSTLDESPVSPAAKYLAYVNRSVADESLQDHDRRFHPDGFDPETDTCGLRKKLATNDSPDTAVSGSSAVKPKESQEYEAVVAKYRNTPLWMKAPNGKPTNLTERQWVQVRTPSFKKWFGDWEAMSSRSAIENAFAPTIQVGAFSREDGESVQTAARKYFNGSVKYKTVVGEVEIDARSGKDSLAHKYGREKLDTITSLQRDFANAVYLRSERDFDGNDIDNHFFCYPIKYDGKRRLVFCRARQDINKNRLYVHEVFLEDEIKSNALQTAAQTNKSQKPHGGIALYRSILQSVYAVNPGKVSKIVDENGEPRVVWKGGAPGVNKFSLSYDRIGFFSDTKSVAAYYNADTEKEPRAFFLNIRNPLALDARGNNFMDIPVPEDVFDRCMPTDMWYKIRRDRTNVPYSWGWYDRKRKTQYMMADEAAMLARGKDSPYDGVLIRNVSEGDDDAAGVGTDIIPRDGRQIKSATDNSGRFSQRVVNVNDESPFAPDSTSSARSQRAREYLAFVNRAQESCNQDKHQNQLSD